MNKVLLVYPPIDDDYYMIGVNDSPPLGLVAIQNYIQRHLDRDIDISIVDGEHSSVDKISAMIRTDDYAVVGVQPMMASYRNSLQIAQTAKRMGSVTVFGGHHSTQLVERIIKRRHDIVDYVVCGDGEEAMLGLLKGDPIKDIPNLAYWNPETKCVERTPVRMVPIDDGRIEQFPAHTIFQYRVNKKDYERGEAVSFRAYSHKGCKNRANSQYCYFCGRADLGFRFKSPEVYLEELRYLIEICNADYVFEIGDDFLQDEEWLSDLIQLKERKYPKLLTNLKIFARANRITQSVVELLHRLNINEVAIGFESGSERILQTISKRATAEQNIRAAELLFENKIDTIASYVLGLPGENDDTLEETYRQALYMRELAYKNLGHPPQEIIGNLLEINPGSRAFSELMKVYPEKYCNEDQISVRETQDDYFKFKFSLDSDSKVRQFRRKLATYSKKLNKLGLYTFPAGWQKEDMQ